MSVFAGLHQCLLAFVGLCWPLLACLIAVIRDGHDMAGDRGSEMLEMGDHGVVQVWMG